DSSYFLPYGGGSPGPRFLVPALPFLALGLGPAFARAPRAVTAVALVSIVATITLTLVWTADIRDTPWEELGRARDGGRWSPLARSATETVVGNGWLVVLAATAAVVLAFAPPATRLRAQARRHPLVLALSAAATAAAAAGVVRLATIPPDLRAGI